MATSRKSTLYFGPVNLDLDTGSASVNLPGGGEVSVSPAGAEVSLPGRGRVSFGPGGGSVEVPGAGRLEVRSDGFVMFPDGTVWNSRGSTFPDVIPTPSPGGPVPIPYPNLGTLPLPNFETTPIKIPIPVPHFVFEKFDIPVALPKLVPHMFELPLPLPQVHPTSVDWRFPAPPQLPSSPFSTPSSPDLAPTVGPSATHVPEIKSAIAQALEHWLPSVQVTHGVINGPVGVIPPGALTSNVDLKAAMRAELASAGVPLLPYGSITDAFAKAWLEWLAGFSVMVHYPAFSLWPGTEAPPMPAVGQLLKFGASSGTPAMSVRSLASAAMNSVDPTALDADYVDAVQQLSVWYTLRFATFREVTILTNVLGRGPIPSYTPIFPVGPVIGGTIIPSSGVLVGSNPFRVP
jgi:hypothetical protein